MADYNNIVTKPVSVQMVARLLGTSKLSVGNLCTSDRINMWAKYKPFRYAQLVFRQNEDPSYDDRDKALHTTNHGLGAPSVRSSTTLAQCVNDVWTYDKPRGGETEPFRLSDFIGYAHNSSIPMEAVPQTEINLYFTYGNEILLGEHKGVLTTDNLSYGDLKMLETYPRFGVLIVSEDWSKKFIKVFNSIPQRVVVDKKELNKLSGIGDNETVSFALLATNHAVTEEFTTQISTSQWIILPCDTEHRMSGKIRFSNNFHFSIRCDGFAEKASDVITTKYTELLPFNADNSYYFLPRYANNYSGYIQFSFTNIGEKVTLKRELFSLYLTRNLTIDANTRSYTPTEMYIGLVQRDEIEVETGMTVMLKFRLPDYIFTMDAMGIHRDIIVSQRKITTQVCIQYSSVQNPVHTQNFRIRDFQ